MTFQEKAKQNILAAESLIKEHYYHSSVNRSYYATFQYSLHILREKVKISEEDLKSEEKKSQKGTHDFAFDKLGTIILSKNKSEDYKWFQKKTREIRKLRKMSDYTENAITPDNAHDSLRISNDLIKLMVENFK